MKRFPSGTTALFVVSMFMYSSALLVAQEYYRFERIASDLRTSWEIEFAPDGRIWCTERDGFVIAIDPQTGNRTTLLDISDRVRSKDEAGLLGFTFHPQFPDSAYFYTTFTEIRGDSFYQVLARYRYEGDTLIDEMILDEWGPVSLFHAGARLAFGHDGKLYMSSGESTQNLSAQDWQSRKGKVLRYNYDGTIPSDNPRPDNPVWAIGLRNPQGLVVTRDGTIYTAEHGPAIEDEINKIERGRNYGWPLVNGPCDDEEELEFCERNNVKGPFYSTGEVTYGVCALTEYTGSRYPGWENALLMSSLKGGRIHILKRSDDGETATSVVDLFTRCIGRIRDFAISPDGYVYVCTSNRDGRSSAGFPRESDDRIYRIERTTQRPEFAEQPHPDTIFANVGESIVHSVTLANTGEAALSIVNWWSTGEISDDFYAHIYDGQQWVRNNGTNAFPLIIEPKSEGLQTGEFVLQAGNIDATRRYTLVISTEFPDVDWAEDTITLRGEVGKPVSYVTSWINSGEYGALTTGYSFRVGRTAVFSVAGETGAYAPGERSTVTITYTADAITARDYAELAVVGNVPDRRRLIINAEAVLMSVEDQSTLSTLVRPQPVTDVATFLLPEDLQAHHLSIIDALGRTVNTARLQHDAGTVVVDASQFTPGAYVAVFEGRHSLRVPFVVARQR